MTRVLKEILAVKKSMPGEHRQTRALHVRGNLGPAGVAGVSGKDDNTKE